MMKSFISILVVCFAGVLSARSVSTELPPVIHADTETTTNVPFVVSLDAVGRFSLTLSCHATPSNNVEVAFGVDRNGNGVLGLEETERVIGWDCGSWFMRRGGDGDSLLEPSVSTGEVKSLVWVQHFDRAGVPLGWTARADGTPVFMGTGASGLYDSSWNMMRLTGRGLDTALENFSVVVTPDGTIIRMR